MGEPSDRLPTGWYRYNPASGRAVHTPDPTIRRARRRIAVAAAASLTNAIILFVAVPGRWPPLFALLSLGWAVNVWLPRLDHSANYHARRWQPILAAGTIGHLGMLAYGWWQATRGLPLTAPVLTAAACQLTVAILAGSVLAGASRSR